MWIPGFSLWRVWVDAMHTLDLGVYQVVCATALVELVEERVWPCVTHEEGITKAYKEYKEVVSRKPLETRTLESPAERAPMR